MQVLTATESGDIQDQYIAQETKDLTLRWPSIHFTQYTFHIIFKVVSIVTNKKVDREAGKMVNVR